MYRIILLCIIYKLFMKQFIKFNIALIIKVYSCSENKNLSETEN